MSSGNQIADKPDGKGTLVLDGGRRTMTSSNFLPTSLSPGTGSHGVSGMKRLRAGEVVYVDVGARNINPERGLERIGVFAQMVHGGKGLVFSHHPDLYNAHTMDQFEAVGPSRLLTRFDEGVHDMAAHASPFYTAGQWVNFTGGSGEFPDYVRMQANIVDVDASAVVEPEHHFHVARRAMELSLPASGNGSPKDWQQLQARLVWGPDDPQDFSSPQSRMVIMGCETTAPDIPLTTNAIQYVTLEVTSYPFRRNLPDDNPLVVGKGGATDSEWGWNTDGQLPTPKVTTPAWIVPSIPDELAHDPTLTEVWGPDDPPPELWTKLEKEGEPHWLVFPVGRYSQSRISLDHDAIYGNDAAAIDWSRITAMQIRVLYKHTEPVPSGVGGEDGNIFRFGPPRLTHNLFDGALVDPSFATDHWMHRGILGYTRSLGFANLGSTDDVIRYSVVPTGPQS